MRWLTRPLIKYSNRFSAPSLSFFDLGWFYKSLFPFVLKKKDYIKPNSPTEALFELLFAFGTVLPHVSMQPNKISPSLSFFFASGLWYP